MFYHFLYPLKVWWFGFNIFRYITFRASMAAVTAFIISLIVGPYIITYLQKLKLSQYVRHKFVDNLEEFFNSKEGTPTMGGLIIIVSVLLSCFLWCRFDNDFVIITLGGMVWLGVVGFMDDYIKIKNKSAEGLRSLT
ncbi:MAG: phospho-N-acetylmuramoyl-pentapeptide-transferase, partial [Candidatus Omnitrophica bacterium]|nr:phospho-N-acetylmuramoyl-pentapeptide-transferase [Candidatus Omnitrophota bacterium]